MTLIRQNRKEKKNPYNSVGIHLYGNQLERPPSPYTEIAILLPELGNAPLVAGTGIIVVHIYPALVDRVG